MAEAKRYRCLRGHVVKPAKNGHVPVFCRTCSCSVRVVKPRGKK